MPSNLVEGTIYGFTGTKVPRNLIVCMVEGLRIGSNRFSSGPKLEHDLLQLEYSWREVEVGPFVRME